MRVIAITNQKGGVGKTTTTFNLGAALSAAGHRVLLVDLDPQGSLTTSAGLEPEEVDKTLYDVMKAAIDDRPRPRLPDVILPTEAGPDLVPANITLSAVDLDLLNAMSGELVLRNVLASVRTRYDYVLIDCLPSLGLLAINALAAAREVLIPLQAEFLPMKGLKLLLHTIGKARQKINPRLAVCGVLLTMVEPRTVHAREVIDSIHKVFEGKVRIFKSSIKRSVKVKEGVVAAQSVLTYAPQSEVAEAFRNLAKEIDHVQEAPSDHRGNGRPDVRRRAGSAHRQKAGQTAELLEAKDG